MRGPYVLFTVQRSELLVRFSNENSYSTRVRFLKFYGEFPIKSPHEGIKLKNY